MSVTSAIILAGGLGTRLRSTVPDLPKPMAPVSERPFLEHQLDYWIEQGVTHFVLSVGYRHEVIVSHFGDRYKTAKLEYVIEDTPLGTGGGLLLALDKVSKSSPFLLLNGDTYFAVNLKVLEEFFLKTDADWCFSLFRSHEADRYMGMNLSPTGRITSLKSGIGQSVQLANGGVYLINPRALNREVISIGAKSSLEDDIFPVALALGQRLMGIEFRGIFIDIGIPEDYFRAPALLDQ